MKHTSLSARPSSNRYVLAGIAIMTAAVLSRPDLLTKVYAAANQYDWIKQNETDLLGGQYSSAARSADGSTIVLTVTHGGEQGSDQQESPLYLSKNNGTTWQNVAPELDPGVQNIWTSVDVSDDGQVIVAAGQWANNYTTFSGEDGKIFVSEDGGSSWDNVTPMNGDSWNHVVVSGDGSKIAAINNDNNNGNIYVSENDGSSWSNVQVAADSSNAWNLKSISLSDNGDKMLVGGENSNGADTQLFFSGNDGADWANISPDPADGVYFSSPALSADGSKIAVSTEGYNGTANDGVFVSSNSGSTWTSVSPDTDNDNNWVATALSDNAAKLSVLDRNGKMYVSSDLGATWAEEDPGLDNADENAWVGLDFNNDGSRAVVIGDQNAYLTGGTTPTAPTASLTDAEGGKSITLTTPLGTTITCHSGVKESGLSASDGLYSYPLGLVDFCFSGADISNQISLVFVTDLKSNEVAVRKFNPNTKTYATVSEATVTETTYNSHHALQVTYDVKDNGPLDTNSNPGEVADPVGLATLDFKAPNTGFEQGKQSTHSSLSSVLAVTTLATGLLIAPIRRKVVAELRRKK